jgi:lysophospholipase L1-like esterase
MTVSSLPRFTPPRPPRLRVRHSFIPLLTILCAFSWLVSPDLHTASAKEPATTKPAPFASEIAAFEKWDRQNAVPKDAILFVGSSSIRLWQTAEAFPDLPVINRGFGGSVIAHVNRYADRIVVKYKPRVIVFYAGDNDIASGKSPQRVFDDFKQFVDLVSPKLPKTHIIFLSIKPSPSRAKFWPKVQQANALIKDFIKTNPQLEYIDIATPMLANDGKPRPELFLDDALHLNATGYEVWNKILGPKLATAVSSH